MAAWLCYFLNSILVLCVFSENADYGMDMEVTGHDEQFVTCEMYHACKQDPDRREGHGSNGPAGIGLKVHLGYLETFDS
jgi:hypothetical protein